MMDQRGTQGSKEMHSLRMIRHVRMRNPKVIHLDKSRYLFPSILSFNWQCKRGPRFDVPLVRLAMMHRNETP
jgi:hypothetical protein